MLGRHHCCRRFVLRKVLRENTTQPRTNVLPLCRPDPVGQVRIDLYAKLALCPALHANYIFQEFSSFRGTHHKRYHSIVRAVPKEDGDLFSLV